jgi:molybdopterin synthase sulfur carrier subunit
MATIEIQFFAQLKDAAKTDRQELALEQGDTASKIYDRLRSTHQFQLESKDLRVAINDSFAPMDQELLAGDKVTFIPPVSGG